MNIATPLTAKQVIALRKNAIYANVQGFIFEFLNEPQANTIIKLFLN